MKSAPATALGIDISETHISLALLKKDAKGIKLVKAARCPLPQGTIESGVLQNAPALLKTIRQLKSRNHIRARVAALSLPAKLILMQIVEMPKQMPANIGHFVRDEVKQYVALSGEKIVSDFCGLSSAHEANNKILVAASDRQKVGAFVRVFGRAGINIDVVEPAVLAFIRACHAKKIAGRFNRNVLLALLLDNTLMLCVFRKQILDLIRKKYLQTDPTQPQNLAEQLGEQISAVTQFYDIEHSGEAKPWQVTVVADIKSDVAASVSAALKTRLSDVDLEVTGLHDAAASTVAGPGAASQPQASAIATGLAMRLLSAGDSTFKVNLLPKEAIDLRLVRRHLLLTANILGAVVLATMLILHIITLTTSKVNQSIQKKIQAQAPQSTSTLVQQQKALDQQIQQLGEGPRVLNELIVARRRIDWAGLLNDIVNAAPRTVCITRLLSKPNFTMSLEGFATSYEAANTFADVLDKSDRIVSASVVEAQKDKDQSLVKYQIDCSMSQPRGN